MSTPEDGGAAGTEISAALADEIASWRRVCGHANSSNSRDLLRQAAGALWRVLAIEATTASPEARDAGHQAAADALFDCAVVMGIGADDAQAIICQAKDDPDQASPGGERPGQLPDEDESPDRAPEFSDEALALRFAELHVDGVRYVALWGKWFLWSGTRWREDMKLRIFYLVRRMCREIARGCENPKTARDIASAKTINAVERLSRADRRLAAATDQWDCDPWLLNTPAGVVDLRSGQLRPHRLDDYITKIAGVAPDAACKIPTWLKFLDRVLNGDADAIAFLQRMVGYMLTGVTREHALFFLWGTGGNGKGTFVNVLTGIWAEYHKTSPIETFVASKTDRHPTELAGLRGARLVTATETEEGRRWAESKIKQITGGDRIAARFMRGDFFEFDPLFKLLFSGNHRPGLRSVDEAIRRRFNLINFDVTIRPEEKDPTLGDKLKVEWPGILAWAIEGCLLWQRNGLAPPAAVQLATASYLEAEDTLGAWLECAGSRDANAFELSKDLYVSWKRWADAAGEYVGSERKFVQRLEDRGDKVGLKRARDAEGRRGFTCLRLHRPDPPPQSGAPAEPEPHASDPRDEVAI
jgi:putative DNA primase/helicase